MKMSELQTLSEEHLGEEAANNFSLKKFSTEWSKLNQTLMQICSSLPCFRDALD